MGVAVTLLALIYTVHVLVWWQVLSLILGGHDVVIVGLLVAAHFWFILYRAERLLRIAAERTNKEQGG